MRSAPCQIARGSKSPTKSELAPEIATAAPECTECTAMWHDGCLAIEGSPCEQQNMEFAPNIFPGPEVPHRESADGRSWQLQC